MTKCRRIVFFFVTAHLFISTPSGVCAVSLTERPRSNVPGGFRITHTHTIVGNAGEMEKNAIFTHRGKKEEKKTCISSWANDPDSAVSVIVRLICFAEFRRHPGVSNGRVPPSVIFQFKPAAADVTTSEPPRLF